MQVQTCPNCKREFGVFSVISGRRYCSTECRVEFQTARRKCRCQQCGVEFLAQGKRTAGVRKFCSKACSNDSSRVDTTCGGCGRVFRLARSRRLKTKPNFCPDCK